MTNDLPVGDGGHLLGAISAIKADVSEVEIVVAHSERATLRVGDVFLKVDADQARLDIEVEAMALAPIPTPQVLWRKPPVLALAALQGTALGVLGEPSTASAGRGPRRGPPYGCCTTRRCRHGTAAGASQLATSLDEECELLVTTGVLPADLVARNRQVAEAVFRPYTPAFIHGDLQITHVFVER